MPTQATHEPLLAGIVERAEALAETATPQAELDRVAKLKEELMEEHAKHEAVVKAAKESLKIHMGCVASSATEWHRDEKPPISDLPEGTAVSYQVAFKPHGSMIRIRLEAERNERTDEGDLVYAGGGISAVFKRDDQLFRFETGLLDAGTDQLLDSASDSFSLTERAVQIVTAGELAREDDRIDAAA